jgi:carbamate kinase
LTVVVALGGNALTRAGERGTAAEQLANLRDACAAIVPILESGDVVVTHGNGPQVGASLLRHERAADEVPPLPLYLAVAETQAQIGAMIATELRPVAPRPVVCVVTHVVVAEDDPAFSEPTKPIGPFYDAERARELKEERGWAMVEDAGRGWRRVVPSPEPLQVAELEAVRALVGTQTTVIACGGGGIPVVERDGALRGVDAVIDKDRASALLAAGLGAERLVILTDVDAVYRDFGSPAARAVPELTADEADALLPQLPPGSMRPKVEAARDVARTGGEALITAADTLGDALAGRAGTRVSPK